MIKYCKTPFPITVKRLSIDLSISETSSPVDCYSGSGELPFTYCVHLPYKAPFIATPLQSFCFFFLFVHIVCVKSLDNSTKNIYNYISLITIVWLFHQRIMNDTFFNMYIRCFIFLPRYVNGTFLMFPDSYLCIFTPRKSDKHLSLVSKGTCIYTDIWQEGIEPSGLSIRLITSGTTRQRWDHYCLIRQA